MVFMWDLLGRRSRDAPEDPTHDVPANSSVGGLAGRTVPAFSPGTGVCALVRHADAEDPRAATPDETEAILALARPRLRGFGAYRLLGEGRPLEDWHPLISGDPESVHRAGISVRGWTVNEDEAGDLEDHLVEREL